MDQQQMEQIYEKNMMTVYKYLFCLTHSAELSEELTQETFYQAIKGIGRFRGDCKISVWLCQIAKRLWYKELERRKRHLFPEPEIETEAVSTVTPEQDVLSSQAKLQLFKQMHKLDPATKEVMYLRLTGELSFAEIGEILEKTETWARVTFYRGKQKLAEEKKAWDPN